jgi:hypothetical protein
VQVGFQIHCLLEDVLLLPGVKENERCAAAAIYIIVLVHTRILREIEIASTAWLDRLLCYK